MKINFIKDKDPNYLSFVVSDAYPELVNAIRRTLISEIPVMAISKVSYVRNNSALYNEMLGLRLGLLPLISDAKTYVLPEKCTCKGKGCAKCTVKFTLDVEGPGMVYARDLKSTDPKIKPVNPDTPLVKLFEGQGVKLEAEAVLGLGKNHARFNACMASYQYYPKITAGCKCKEAAEACPRDVLDYKARKVQVKNLKACNLCLACVDACKKGCGKMKVEGRVDKFIFNVESWGQYKPNKLVKLAIDSLKDRADELAKLVK